MTKTQAAGLLKRDYIPNGKPVDCSKLTFRRTGEHEVYQCCHQVGYDVQSGPLYCGDIAEWISEVITEGGRGVIALCKRDAPPKSQRDPDPFVPDFQI